MSRFPLEMRYNHRHCQYCTLGDGTAPILFLHDRPLVSQVDDMKMTIQDLVFPRLVLKLSAKEPLKRLTERVSD